MVITRIRGGLGNQMFQYACGRAVSEATNSELKLDLSWFDKGASYSHDKFFLDEYNIQKNIASNKDMKSLFPFGKYGKRFADSNYYRMPWFFQTVFNFYDEVAPSHPLIFSSGPVKREFHSELFNTDGKCYLNGYWVSEKYFNNQIVDISDQLKDELTLKRDLTGKNLQIANSIKESTAVSIHDRRRDFLKYGWDLNIDYYTNAIDRIATEDDNIQLYIFSDDISWIKENLDTEYQTQFITHNGIEDCVEDIRLMSLCDHNIVSSSSFAWWGAWLNRNENKRVIAPMKWRDCNTHDVDIIPDGWEIIS